MPYATVNGAKIYYEDKGSGPETVVFAHGLLWSGRMFDNQVEALKDRYRCITFDFRGQGRSEVTERGYDMDTLSRDAASLIEELGAGPCHFVGLSMGGFVGMRLTIRRPELINSLILIGTSADPEPRKNLPQYLLFLFLGRLLGLRPLAGSAMRVMFGKEFLKDPERAELRRKWRQRFLENDPTGVTRAMKGVITREAIYDKLDHILVPTLILVGESDVATVPEKSRRMHSRIPDSRLVVLPRAGHTATVEEPEAVNEAILDFLQRHGEAATSA